MVIGSLYGFNDIYVFLIGFWELVWRAHVYEIFSRVFGLLVFAVPTFHVIWSWFMSVLMVVTKPVLGRGPAVSVRYVCCILFVSICWFSWCVGEMEWFSLTGHFCWSFFWSGMRQARVFRIFEWDSLYCWSYFDCEGLYQRTQTSIVVCLVSV